MLLRELVVGEKLTLEVEIKGNAGTDNFEFKSSVAVIVKESVLIEPVRVNDRVVGFSAENVRVNLLLTREDKAPMIWRRIGVSTVTYKENTYYKVTSKDLGLSLNRRGSYRLFLGTQGVVQMGINRKAINVIVKDISENGFSFVSDENFEKSENTAVRIVFNDNNKNFSLSGLVVRKTDVNNEKFIYGCKLTAKNQVLCRFINEKQRELISKKNDSVSDGRAKMKDLDKMIRSTDEKALNQKISGGVRNNIVDIEKTDRRELFKQK